MFLFNTMYAGYTLSPELIAELADLDNVCGIKNPQAPEHLLRVQALAGDRIVVTDASERHWLELHTEHGFQALMSTPALALYPAPGRPADRGVHAPRGLRRPRRGAGARATASAPRVTPSIAGCASPGSSAA